MADADARKESWPTLRVRFYRTVSGTEPVRDWLINLDKEKRRKIGIDIKTVQFGWPMGMPLVRKLERGLWETRSHLPGGIARVMSTVDGSTMILLHGFIKKSQATPQQDLATARRRLADLGVKDDEQEPNRQ